MQFSNRHTVVGLKGVVFALLPLLTGHTQAGRAPCGGEIIKVICHVYAQLWQNVWTLIMGYLI